MVETNLNMLFIDQISNFAHLITVKPQTKEEFKETVKNAYDVYNPKTHLFYISIDKSEFEIIRLSKNRDKILFNQ